MRTVTYKCDHPGCDKLYTANNGWYLVRRAGLFTVIGAWTQDEDLNTFEHYCGMEHFWKRVSTLTGKEL